MEQALQKDLTSLTRTTGSEEVIGSTPIFSTNNTKPFGHFTGRLF
jgi:hypothetical protein